jgi:hypothetical protein
VEAHIIFLYLKVLVCFIKQACLVAIISKFGVGGDNSSLWLSFAQQKKQTTDGSDKNPALLWSPTIPPKVWTILENGCSVFKHVKASRVRKKKGHCKRFQLGKWVLAVFLSFVIFFKPTFCFCLGHSLKV